MLRHSTKITLVTSLAFSALLLLVGLLWLLNFTPAAYAQSQPDALGSLSGTVRDTKGNPLPNITVWLEHPTYQYPRRQVTTNVQGIYQFQSVFSGDYQLRFEDAESHFASAYYTNASFPEDATKVTINGNAVSGVDMELETAGAISITLQNAEPITITQFYFVLYRQTAGGHWTAYQTLPQYEGKSALISGLPSGTYRLCVQVYTPNQNEYLTECYANVLPESFDQPPDNATNIDVHAGKETKVTMTVNDQPQVQGFIRNGNNQPVAGIVVRLRKPDFSYEQVTESDQHGHFYFDYLIQGPYKLLFNYPNDGENPYLSAFYPDAHSEADAQAIAIDASTRLSITQTLVRESRIMGKITLSDSVPAGDVIVNVFQAQPDDTWLQSNCNPFCSPSIYDSITGMYTVTQLAAGRYRLSAAQGTTNTGTYLEAYYGGSTLETATDITLTSGATKTNIDFSFGESEFDSTISGVVTGNGAARPGIEVGLFSLFFPSYNSLMPFVTTTTDAKGRYKFQGLGAGTYQVAFHDPAGHYATTFFRDLDLKDYGQPLFITQTTDISNINISLSPGATIRGHVLTPSGQPSADYVVQILPITLNQGPFGLVPLPYTGARSGPDGSFAVTGLPPGSYFLRIQIPYRGPGQAIDSDPNTYRYYAATDNVYASQTISLEQGQTVVGKDVFLFGASDNFMPFIQRGSTAVR